MQNVDDGLDLLSTAEGALNNIYGMLQRLRDLAETAANGTYAEDSRNAMQAEADELVDQIGLVRETTEYNGLSVFSKKKSTPANGGVATTMFSLPPPTSVSEPDSIESTSSPPVMMASAPMMMSASPVMMAAEPVAEGETIQGAEDFNGSQTKTITIDGVTYEVTNRQSVASSFAYTKDMTTGQITFLCDNFTIKGQVDVSHNLLINGQSNIVYGGDKADTIEETSNSVTTIYGQGGDDTIILNNNSLLDSYAYGGLDNDTITSNGPKNYLYGAEGEDTLVINSYDCNVYGGADNDIIKVNAGNNTIRGGAGDDKFYITGNNNTINGDGGTNTIEQDTGTGNTKVNVVGSTEFSVDFTGSETKTVTINGIDYAITNKSASANTLIYSLNGTQINFKSGNFSIKGDENVAHDVKLSKTGLYFHGGKLADKVEVTNYNNYIYTYEGDDSITFSAAATSILVYSGSGDDTITAKGYCANNLINTGEGNDTLNMKSISRSSIDTGSGDDTITATTLTAAAIYGGEGTNTISYNTNTTGLISGFGDKDNASVIELNKNETKNITVDGVDYTVKNNLDRENILLYSTDSVTGFTSFAGHQNEIKTASNNDLKINLYGRYNHLHTAGGNDTINVDQVSGRIYTYSGNDTITGKGSDYGVYAGDGDDTLICQAAAGFRGEGGNDTLIFDLASDIYTSYGGDGDDIYYINKQAKISDTSGNNIYHINTDGVSITAGMDGDTFYVNGNDNTVKGSGGDDYFIITGNNNTVDGGTGTNYYVDKGTGTTYSNSEKDPYVGELTFTTLDEEQTFEVNGKTYTVKNNASGNNVLSYSFNPNTGILNLDGSDFEINAKSDEAAIIDLNGDNNTINGSNLEDKISVKSGTNNIINGNAGNDTLVSDSENNSLNGGANNDTININKSTNKAITGGDGNDTINVTSDNNTNIDSGIGDDKLNISGSNNTVDAGIGNDTITTSGNSNTINAGDGNNKLTITGNSNTLTAGGGNNTLGVGGNNNNITVEKIQNDININGNGNNVTQTYGDNNVSIKGNNNTYTSTNGQKEVNIIGNNNAISTTDSDDEFVIKGNSNIIESTGGENKVDIKGNSNEYQGGNGIDNIKINGDTNILLGGDSNDSFLINKGASNIIDGQNGDKNTMINYGTGTNYTNIIDMTPDAFSCDLQVGLNSSDESVINIKIDFSLAGFEVDLSTTENARDALVAIDEVLERLNKEHLNIGATMNRLESVREAQIVQLDNITSSLSILKDADIAEETTKLINKQILQQASASLLLQTRNLRQESVLQLLNGLNAR